MIMELLISAFKHGKLSTVFQHLSSGESCLKTESKTKHCIMEMKQRHFETESSVHPFANNVTGRQKITSFTVTMNFAQFSKSFHWLRKIRPAKHGQSWLFWGCGCSFISERGREKGISQFLDTGLFGVLFVSKVSEVGQFVCACLCVHGWVRGVCEFLILQLSGPGELYPIWGNWIKNLFSFQRFDLNKGLMWWNQSGSLDLKTIWIWTSWSLDLREWLG